MEKLKRNLIPVTSIITVVLYPCLFMYFQNVGEGDFKEIFHALGLFAGLAVIIYTVTVLLMKNCAKASLYTDLAMLVAMNFRTILGGGATTVSQFESCSFFRTVRNYFSCSISCFYKNKIRRVCKFL